MFVPSYTALADFEVFLCCKTIFIVHAQNKRTAIDFYWNPTTYPPPHPTDTHTHKLSYENIFLSVTDWPVEPFD
jgi:hypothetical protein